MSTAGVSRLILLSTRSGGDSVGIVVERVLGLRNLAQFTTDAVAEGAPAWQVAGWRDAEALAWQEIDLGMLARDPAFLQVGA